MKLKLELLEFGDLQPVEHPSFWDLQSFYYLPIRLRIHLELSEMNKTVDDLMREANIYLQGKHRIGENDRQEKRMGELA